MQHIVLDAEVSEIPAELARRGIPANTRVHVTIEVADEPPPMTRLAQAGRAFDWLADEPDLYGDADIAERAG